MIEAIERTEEAEALPEFHITDRATADWYLRQVSAIEAEIALWKAQAEEAIASLQTEKAGLEWRFAGELEHWAEGAITEQRGTKKSLTLGHGTLSFRTCPEHLRLDDEAAATEWASRSARDLVTVSMVSKLDTVAFRTLAEERLQQSGELIPGVVSVAERESFSVSFGKKKPK